MKTSIKISGMHCKSCKILIEEVLSEIEGVVSSNVDFKKGEAVIEHTKEVGMEKIKKEIESLGDYKILGRN